MLNLLMIVNRDVLTYLRCFEICPEILKKITKHLSELSVSRSKFDPGTSRVHSEALPADPVRSVTSTKITVVKKGEHRVRCGLFVCVQL
jgi:hypothetical protein